MSRKPKEPIGSDSLPETVTSLNSAAHAHEDDLAISFYAHDNPLPSRLGRYRIEGEIARGGMGLILLAHDELLRRDVAIKLLLNQYSENSSLQQRFVNEALITSRLQHPCIVPIYDHGHADDERPYFAMKLVTGQSLGKILASPPKNQMDRSRLLKIFEQICLTIAYAHREGILHLDLKPGNIMVGEFGEVYVMDWGLARTALSLEEVGHARQSVGSKPNTPLRDLQPVSGVHGTPAYMAPEQARGLTVCPRSDVFGLGALLCEILTGRPPYRDEDFQRAYVDAIRAELGDALRGLDACQNDDRLIQLAKRCLSPNPEDRPINASSVANEISHYLESALQQAESDLCRFFDLSLDLFCIASMDGYFRRVNANFPRVLGYTEQQLISRPFVDFVHPEDVNETINVMRDLLAGRPVVHFCNRYRHSEGYYVKLEWTAKSIVEENTIFAVARDVTDRWNPA